MINKPKQETAKKTPYQKGRKLNKIPAMPNSPKIPKSQASVPAFLRFILIYAPFVAKGWKLRTKNREIPSILVLRSKTLLLPYTKLAKNNAQ